MSFLSSGKHLQQNMDISLVDIPSNYILSYTYVVCIKLKEVSVMVSAFLTARSIVRQRQTL